MTLGKNTRFQIGVTVALLEMLLTASRCQEVILQDTTSMKTIIHMSPGVGTPGSSTVTNNDGTIESQVRANPSAGFSIVTYTGTGSNATVGHGLGVAPGNGCC